MKYRSPIGGLNSLTKLSGGLHVLRILLLVPLTILLHLRKAAAAVLLGLMLLLDLAANLLARRFDLADGFSAALDWLRAAADSAVQSRPVRRRRADALHRAERADCRDHPPAHELHPAELGRMRDHRLHRTGAAG